MDTKIDHPRAPERAPSQCVGEFDIVRLVRNVIGPEGSFDKGSTGTIVYIHRDGVAFEVEIVSPVHAVVTVEAADVERLTV
jgi:hypothetical protein